MKDIVKRNIILYDVLPIILYSIIFLVFTFIFKAWFILFGFILVIEEAIKLKRNLKKSKKIQEKLNEIDEIIYEYRSVFFGNSSIICAKDNMFIVDYSNINYIDFDRRFFVDFRIFSIVMTTQDKKRYEIMFPDYFYPFSLLQKQELLKMIEIIKSHNPEVKLYGKIRDMYEQNL